MRQLPTSVDPRSERFAENVAAYELETSQLAERMSWVASAGAGRKIELPFTTDAERPIDLWKPEST